MRLQNIPWPRELEFGAAGLCSAMAAVATGLSDMALQILGVPLPVVLAAAAGAFIARSYAEKSSFGRALAMVAAWTVAGCALAPLAQAVFAAGAARLGLELTLPTNVMAAFAGVMSAASWWLPIVWPMVLSRLGLAGIKNGGGRE